MKISPKDLTAGYECAKTTWPFITEVNDAHGMPKRLLYAVGSRKTNLRNVVGDGSHGHGVFHSMTAHTKSSPDSTTTSGPRAAQMLKAAFRRFGDWVKDCNYYNSGHQTPSTPQAETTAPTSCNLATLNNGLAGTKFSTWGTHVRTQSAPSTTSPVVRMFPGPTTVTVACQKHAELVTADGHTNDAWSQLSDGSWLSNIYIKGAPG
jgi:hypothetical protein